MLEKSGWVNDTRYQEKKMEPPDVPRFWHFAPLTLRSTESPTVMRRKIFKILKQLEVDIETMYPWKYRLQQVHGSAYLDIQCQFFKQGDNTIVDINLLSGERYVWHHLTKNIRKMLEGVEHRTTCPFPKEFDANPEQWLSLVEHGSMDDKRRAMRRLALSNSDFDVRKIELWLHKPARTFLEREIRRWAEKIKGEFRRPRDRFNGPRTIERSRL